MTLDNLNSLLCKKENAHEDNIYCCAWTTVKPTGDSKESPKNYIVTGGLDGLVKVWTIHNNKLDLLHVLEGHGMAVISIAVSPDGYTIASTSLDSKLIIWELTSGIKVHEIENPTTDSWKVAFSPDGNYVVATSHTGKLVMYNIATRASEMLLDTRGKFPVCVAWSKDGKHIASGAVDGKVCIFDVNQGKLLHTLDTHTDSITSVDFSPNSKLLVTASKDGFIKLFNVASGNEVDSMDFKDWVLMACFRPDGSQIAAGMADGTVALLAQKGLKTLHTFKEHSSMVLGLQFNETSRKLVSVSKDKSINIYQCATNKKS